MVLLYCSQSEDKFIHTHWFLLCLHGRTVKPLVAFFDGSRCLFNAHRHVQSIADITTWFTEFVPAPHESPTYYSTTSMGIFQFTNVLSYYGFFRVLHCGALHFLHHGRTLCTDIRISDPRQTTAEKLGTLRTFYNRLLWLRSFSTGNFFGYLVVFPKTYHTFIRSIAYRYVKKCGPFSNLNFVEFIWKKILISYPTKKMCYCWLSFGTVSCSVS